MESERAKWGTWEELLLGGAVLRHGTRAWNAVATEIRARTLFPDRFTAQECNAKYNALRERYDCCGWWFEELRKQRVAELKRALEDSEDSIGSLRSRLQSLLNDRQGRDAKSITPMSSTHWDTVESSDQNERSKDRSSATSFTQDTARFWSASIRPPAETSCRDEGTKLTKEAENTRQANSARIQSVELETNLRRVTKRRRGERRRKACGQVKEASAGESDVMSSAQVAGSAAVVASEINLTALLDSVMADNRLSVFQCPRDTQKRARYKKNIRRHVDFRTIGSNIKDGSISSRKELYRDLLLLANNAIAYYSKSSPEHRSALALLHSAVVKKLRLDSTAAFYGKLLFHPPTSNAEKPTGGEFSVPRKDDSREDQPPTPAKRCRSGERRGGPTPTKGRKPKKG